MDQCVSAEDLLTIPEASRAAKMCERSMYRNLNAGIIRARKHGRRTFVERAEIVRFLNTLPVYGDAD